jgi:hypothetical protein
MTPVVVRLLAVVALLVGALVLSVIQILREQRLRILVAKSYREQLGALGNARDPASSELPADDAWPAGYKPDAHLGVARDVTVTNGHGGELALKVRGGAFRVVSFTRPTKFDPLSGGADTTDLWLSVDELVKKVKEPWA